MRTSFAKLTAFVYLATLLCSPTTLAADLFGDALPEGAIVRLGTLRWRAGGTVVCGSLLPDSKNLLTVNQDFQAQLWDLATGKVVREFDAGGAAPANGARVGLVGRNSGVSISGDGKRLAVSGRDMHVRIWDLENGKELVKIEGTPASSNYAILSRDGKMLATIGTASKISIYDASTGKDIRSFGVEATGPTRILPNKLEFSADGKSLIQAGLDLTDRKITPQIILWDPHTGKEIRRLTEFPGGASGSLVVNYSAFSPDHKWMAIAEMNKVVLMDLATGKEGATFEDAAAMGRSRNLVFSADGKFLAGLGATGNAVTIWDVNKATVLYKSAKEDKPPVAGIAVSVGRVGSWLALSADGKVAAWAEGPALRVLDVATGKDQSADGGHTWPLREARFARDGKSVLTRADDMTIRRWDAATGKECGRIEIPGQPYYFVALSPDEKLIATGDLTGVMRLSDAATGKELHTISTDRPRVGTMVEFSPDSKLLALADRSTPAVKIVDTTSGKELRTLALAHDGAPDEITVAAQGRRIAFSADSKFLAVGDSSVTVWNLDGGYEYRRITLADAAKGVRQLAFAPDGRSLAVERQNGEITVYELATGKPRLTLSGTSGPSAPAGSGPSLISIMGGIPQTLIFSTSGRVLAQAGEDRKIRLWDVRGGKELGTFTGHRGSLSSVAFSVDGRRLVSASSDTTALVWDVEPLLKKLAPTLAAVPKDKAESLWSSLASNDATAAYSAVRALAGDESVALMLVREHFKPAVAADEKQVRQLIADLESEDFDVREKAHKELGKLGELARPSLRAAIKGAPSAELRRSVEELLSTQGPEGTSSERLLVQRAVEVLELLGSPEAISALKSIAGGAPEALPTVQAKAALERLAKSAGGSR
jgi:WD40 repeat protein